MTGHSECITQHPGFRTVCLDFWVLQTAYFQYRRNMGDLLVLLRSKIYTIFTATNDIMIGDMGIQHIDKWYEGIGDGSEEVLELY